MARLKAGAGTDVTLGAVLVDGGTWNPANPVEGGALVLAKPHAGWLAGAAREAENAGTAEKVGAALGSDLGTWNPAKAGVFAGPNDKGVVDAGAVLKPGMEVAINGEATITGTGVDCAEPNGEEDCGDPNVGAGRVTGTALKPKDGDGTEASAPMGAVPSVGTGNDPEPGAG